MMSVTIRADMTSSHCVVRLLLAAGRGNAAPVLDNGVKYD